MVEFVTGDMFESGADILVNTVNCEGVMGAGIAAIFRERYPAYNVSYQEACDDYLRPGKMHVYYPPDGESHPILLSFPTKWEVRRPSQMWYVSAGLDRLAMLLNGVLKGKSIAIPALGCGLGGLDWNRVKAEIATKLEGIPNVKVFEPH